MTAALLIIDVQNDYFPGGALPLWNAEATLDAVVDAIDRARARGEAVVLVQHVAASTDSPLFQAGTTGVGIHSRILAAAPDAPVIVKQYADSFHQTRLSGVLADLGATRLRIAGMMTQNCVVFTALSRDADGFAVKVIGDLCTAPIEVVHRIALNAIGSKTTLVTAAEAGLA